MNEENTKKQGKLSTIIGVILCVILMPIIILNTIMIAKTYVDPDHIPDAFGVSPVIVLSNSMQPVFSANGLIFIKDVDTNTLEKGDIITFLQGQTAITHRIEEVVKTDGVVSYVTKGDANNIADRLAVSPHQIEGKYIGHVDGLGGAVLFMQSTTGMILFIVAPILLYIAFDILKRRKESEGEKNRTAELEAELARLKAEKEETTNK